MERAMKNDLYITSDFRCENISLSKALLVPVAPVDAPEDLSVTVPNEFLGNNIGNLMNKEYSKEISESETTLISAVDGRFELQHLSEETTAYLVFVVRCDERRSTIFRIGGYGAIQLFINGRIAAQFISKREDSETLLYPLQSGENILVVRIRQYRQRRSLTLRLCDETIEKKSACYPLYQDHIEHYVENAFSLISPNFHCYQGGFRFFLLPRDFTHMPPLVRVGIYDKNHQCLDTLECTLQKVYHLDLQKYRQNNSLLILYINEDCRRVNRNRFRYVILLEETKNLVSNIRLELEQLQNERRIPNEIFLNLSERFRLIQMENNPRFFLDWLEQISDLLSFARLGKDMSDYLFQKKQARYFYRSSLDGKISMYQIFLPKEYNANDSRRYPVMIELPPHNYSPHTRIKYENRIQDDVIFVDVSTRGYTFGSYVGEASFFEILRLIKSRYKVDEERIYLSGYSGGAFAAWTLAQNYPHLFAGVVTASGAPDKNLLENCKNLNIVSITAAHDPNYTQELIDSSKYLSMYKRARYDEIMIENGYHGTLQTAHESSYVQDLIFQHKRVRFPHEVSYKTYWSYHGAAYWVTIRKFIDPKKMASVDAKLKMNGYIHIRCQNVDSLQIQVPPFFSHYPEITFIINEQKLTMDYSNGKNALVTLCRNKDTWHFQNRCPHLDSSDSLGLLSVFLSNVCIVTPSVYTSEQEKKWIGPLAKRLSFPKTNGIIPDIYVKYPICSDSEITKEHLKNSNLIVIGSFDSPLVKTAIDERCSLRSDGCTIYNDKYCCDYSLLLLTKNPFSKCKKVLLITANKPQVALKNYFIRNFTLPAYRSGIHPFLNAQALLFDGKRYVPYFS